MKHCSRESHQRIRSSNQWRRSDKLGTQEKREGGDHASVRWSIGQLLGCRRDLRYYGKLPFPIYPPQKLRYPSPCYTCPKSRQLGHQDHRQISNRIIAVVMSGSKDPEAERPNPLFSRYQTRSLLSVVLSYQLNGFPGCDRKT